MKTVLAFMVGVLVGALFASGGWLMARYDIQTGRSAEALLSDVQAAYSDAASLSWLLKADAPHPVVRWPVARMVRMTVSSVVLAYAAPQSAPPVVQEPSQIVSRPAVVESARLSPPVAASKPAASAATPTLSARQQYGRALKSYEAGRFERAREEFARFMTAHPGHDLVPNAIYWSGETWYSQGRLELAAQAFTRVLLEHPRHAKSPDALLKLAYTALRQGQTGQARAYLDQLQATYPQSRASRLGREARSRLQGDNEPALAVAVGG